MDSYKHKKNKKFKITYFGIISTIISVMLFTFNFFLIATSSRFSSPNYIYVDYIIAPVFSEMGELIKKSEYILRARVVYKSQEESEHINQIGLASTETYYFEYNSYKMEILNVYKFYDTILFPGDIIEIIQIRSIHEVLNIDFPGGRGQILQIINYTPFEIGYDLILFLSRFSLPPRADGGGFIFYDGAYTTITRGSFSVLGRKFSNEFIINNQSAYVYTPYHLRIGHDNWIFESVDPNNELILTEEILNSIESLDNLN